jgi:DNA anti-recombination protein RmuC
MEKDILYALHIAEKLQEDGNVQQQNVQPQQQQAASQQVQQQAPIDEKTLEQAFEAALKNTKDEILKSFQTTLEKFGEQLVENIKKSISDNNKGNMEVSTNSLNQASGMGGNNQQQQNNQNNGGNN